MRPTLQIKSKNQKRTPVMCSCILATAVAISLVCFSGNAVGQASTSVGVTTANNATQTQSRASGFLRQLNASLVSLTKQVTPAVVQIMVTAYGPVEHANRPGDVALFAREHDIGSGVILDPDGYIITNAHVVEGAQRIRVALSLPIAAQPFDAGPRADHRILEAKLVGSDKQTDLAVLKVDAHGLPILGLAATRAVFPGEMVLAVGSPEGLQNTVTMGVVSSVWRQPDPDDPAAYIQTDAPINPGNSGGPLVDADGYVVGLNTMMLSESGGSEGLGFAIPARTVQFVYENLRKYGYVHRTEIQASAQEITPTLAEGLDLPRDWGVIISDVSPKGPAAFAGLKVGDIVYSVDGRPISGLPAFSQALYLHMPDEAVSLDVLRGSAKVSLVVPALQHRDEPGDLADFIDSQNFVEGLGVFVHDFDEKVRGALHQVRIASGVVVVAQSPSLNSYTSNLRTGDILHSVNNTPVDSIEQLRSKLNGTKSGQAVVLQIERDGKLQYVACEWGD
jgi:serine protease Do